MRTLLPALLVSLLAAGCGRAALTVQAENHTRAVTPARGDAAAPDADTAASDGDAAPGDAPAAAEAAPAREPGDFVAYRFSGSFRKAPLTLTQRVAAREGSVLVIDMTLAGGGATEALRVRMSDAPETRGEVLSAARLGSDGAERPAPLAAYEALIAKTALAADANEAELGEEAVTLDVGGAPLACRKVSYRVRVGKSTATMRTIQSDAFAWGDVGGEITAEDGRVLYRAEIVDAGRAGATPSTSPTSKGAAVATSDYED
jgi:hypothetical protein